MTDLFYTTPSLESLMERDRKIQQASKHAGKLWNNLALDSLKRFAKNHTSFLAEEARMWAEEQGLPEPPDTRSWGAVLRTAAKLKIVKADGVERAANSSYKIFWRSLIKETK